MLIRYADEPNLSLLQMRCNTENDRIFDNVAANLAKAYPKFKDGPATSQPAIVCGSGPSLAESVEIIRAMQKRGGRVFAHNGAARFLVENGIKPYAQILVDPRRENLEFVERPWAEEVWLASQCHPVIFERCEELGYPIKMWHPGIPEMQKHIPAKSTLLIGGGMTVGLSGLCLVHASGHKELHLFGYDSSHREDKSHAFPQEINKHDELVSAVVDSKKFTCSLGMASQAGEWNRVAKALIDEGCELHVHGEGLIPTMWRFDQREKAVRVLNAVYDLGVSPPTYDFLSFLVEAERFRIQDHFNVIDVIFQPGPMHGFRSDELPPDVPTREGMLWRVCAGMARLLPSVRSIEICGRRRPVTGDVFPIGWEEDSPMSHYAVGYLKGARPILQASEYARKQVARMPWSQQYATITLRQSSYWPDRNSNMAAWQEAADWLYANNICPVFVPETGARRVQGWDNFMEASWDIDMRAALYEGAIVNLGVANGPMTLCAYLGARYLIFRKELQDASSAEFLTSHGYKPGEGFGGNGKMIWQADDAETIIAELKALGLSRKEKSCRVA